MEHPIRMTLSDDERRTRLTVAFRAILAIPHIIWLSLWGIAAVLAVIVSWFATLIAGRTPGGLHDFIAQYLRYSTQVTGYLTFLADPYPGFLGDRDYPSDLVVAPPVPQNRWITAFRIIIAIPALIVAGVLQNVLQVLAIIAWFVCLFIAEMPPGLRDINAFMVRFNVQTNAYVGLLTERYPSFTLSPTT